jgi:hypothetical protein
MKTSGLRVDHLVFGSFAGAIASYALLSSHWISDESAFMLIIFNFVFVSLTFPLNGTLRRKLCMLLLGNVVGLVWNYVFSLFAVTTTSYFGELFEALYLIFNPFFNLVWIVSFWSLSLTVLAGSENRRVGLRLDN